MEVSWSGALSRAEEAFQLDGRKDNVLLQIEKALLPRWILSDLVTVRREIDIYRRERCGDPTCRRRPVGSPEKIAAFGSSYRETHFSVGAAEGCDLFKLTYIYYSTTDHFPPTKPSAKVRGFQFPLRSKGPA
ncbi:hypothetical protein [Pseudomonas fluorescens]|uniref:hypothetical protein n=1 Tax=Pseudomonas fluorescens TaxID=294 RepID=UPI001240403A|nr:hypothetical protein [Pseudomonas fluorescens]